MAASEGFTWLTAVAATGGAIAGLVSFVVGARVGKDQTDRATLRTIYQELYSHFVEMGAAIDRGKPLRWEDFPQKVDHYSTPLRAMEIDGRAALIPQDVLLALTKAEVDSLRAAGKLGRWLSSQLNPFALELFSSRVDKYTKAPSGRPYLSRTLWEVALDDVEQIAKDCARLDSGEVGLGLETALERGRTTRLFAYQDHLYSGSVSDIVRDLRDRIDAEGGRELVSAMRSARKSIEAVKRLLTGRIQEPIPLHESLTRAWRDINPRRDRSAHGPL